MKQSLHGLETKRIPIARGSAAEGRIAGYASLFGQADQSGDVVAPGAFRRSLERLRAAGRQVKLLWQHDPARPIGVWTSVAEDQRGLKVEGRLLPEVTQGAEAAALLAAGAIDGLSIGYRTLKSEPIRATGGRKLIELDLWEVSLVTFPMLPTARASLDAPARVDDLPLALAQVLQERR